jgi:hypothetical protein
MKCYSTGEKRRDEMLGFYKNNDFVYKLTVRVVRCFVLTNRGYLTR